MLESIQFSNFDLCTEQQRKWDRQREKLKSRLVIENTERWQIERPLTCLDGFRHVGGIDLVKIKITLFKEAFLKKIYSQELYRWRRDQCLRWLRRLRGSVHGGGLRGDDDD